jgi:hypothetical protein
MVLVTSLIYDWLISFSTSGVEPSTRCAGWPWWLMWGLTVGCEKRARALHTVQWVAEVRVSSLMWVTCKKLSLNKFVANNIEIHVNYFNSTSRSRPFVALSPLNHRNCSTWLQRRNRTGDVLRYMLHSIATEEDIDWFECCRTEKATKVETTKNCCPITSKRFMRQSVNWGFEEWHSNQLLPYHLESFYEAIDQWRIWRLT